MINPCATYDALYVMNKLEEYIGESYFSEVQLFCYFSALLSLYNGEPVSYWSYSFIKNELGAPLSAEIESSFDNLLNVKEVEQIGNCYRLTQKGKNKLHILAVLPRLSNRNKYLENACDSLLALPIGTIKFSIVSDPIIKSASSASIRNLINDNTGITKLLYEHFSILKKILKTDTKNLFIPAVTWVDYLKRNQELNENA